MIKNEAHEGRTNTFTVTYNGTQVADDSRSNGSYKTTDMMLITKKESQNYMMLYRCCVTKVTK